MDAHGESDARTAKRSFRFLDPRALMAVANRRITARRVVAGLLAGIHKSHMRGFDVTFSEHRPYQMGDEIKTIDWRLWGKTDRYYVKQFEEETASPGLVILDRSASMRFAGGGRSKLEYGGFLAATLGHLLLSQRDPAGLALFSDRIEAYIPPRSGQRHLATLLERLETEPPGGGTAVRETFLELASRFRRRGLILVISDLYDDQAGVIGALRHLRKKKNEVLVFHLVDPHEVTLPYLGDCTFRDLESGEELTGSGPALAETYRGLYQAFLGEYDRAFRDADIEIFRLSTETPFEVALTRALALRALRR